MDLKDVWYKYVDWIHLAQEEIHGSKRDPRKALVNMLLNFVFCLKLSENITDN